MVMLLNCTGAPGARALGQPEGSEGPVAAGGFLLSSGHSWRKSSGQLEKILKFSTSPRWWYDFFTILAKKNILAIPNIQYDILWYLENHKDKIFCPYGFGHFFCPLRVFSKYGHVRLQTLYLQVNLVNSVPEVLDLSDWFRQYECLI